MHISKVARSGGVAAVLVVVADAVLQWNGAQAQTDPQDIGPGLDVDRPST